MSCLPAFTSGDGDNTGLKVNITPSETEHFSASHPRVNGQFHEGPEFRVEDDFQFGLFILGEKSDPLVI